MKEINPPRKEGIKDSIFPDDYEFIGPLRDLHWGEMSSVRKMHQLLTLLS